MLCRFMHTVGSTLEAKTLKKQNELMMLNWYFDRLLELSKDKSVNSRIRFNIEEVIEMRNKVYKQY